MSKKEVRKFKMHPDLLFSVIKSQAGTHEKALLEAVMNAVDANATKCEITVDKKGFYIIDNGKGFSSKEQIEDFFETFGTPHKEGDAVYGKFRMGRGQIFAFSKNTWTTNTFKMEVDIKNNGLDYHLKTDLPEVVGCHIKGSWYEELTTSELFNLVKELEKLIKYMQIPVYLNKKLTSVDPTVEKWTYSEDDFFINVDKNASTLSVYNMGALVNHFSSSKFGVGGTIVTKKALLVNFARNDTLTHQCSLWKKISKKLNEILEISAQSKSKLSDEECSSILNNILNETFDIDKYFQTPIIPDINNKKISIHQLLTNSKISFTDPDLNLKLQQSVNDRKIAVVLKSSVLSQFNINDGSEFISKLKKIIDVHNDKLQYSKEYKRYISCYCKVVCVPITELIKDISSLQNIKDIKKYTKKEKALIQAIKSINYQIVWAINQTLRLKNMSQIKTRSINIGVSAVSNAWTDGVNYIAINESLVNSNVTAILHTLVHEYCHNNSSFEYHEHGLEFYELFHDVLIHSSIYIQDALIILARKFNQSLYENNVKPYIKLEQIDSLFPDSNDTNEKLDETINS